MSDPKVYIWCVFIVAAAIVTAIYILRDRITSFRGKFSKKGLDVDLKAAESAKDPTSIKVDLTGAEFKEQNKFVVDGTSEVKATNLKAGRGNEFKIGSDSGTASREKS